MAALLTACAPVVPSAVEQAETELARVLAGVHERALNHRAGDPTAIGAAAAERLADALTGGNPTVLVSTAATPEGVEVVTTHGVRVQVSGGLFAEQVTLGTCLLTRATPGSSTGDVGERGTVSTEAVPCPDGLTPATEGYPVEATTTELEGLRAPVPMPRPAAPPCFSGSDDCASGGG